MTLLKVGLFSFLVIAFFAVFANSLPQFRTDPPKEIVIKPGEVTIEQMIQIGKDKFEVVCKLCHNPALAGRAPEPTGMAIRAVEIINDPDYKAAGVKGSGGKATTVEEYIRESMICPACFVVGGFGVKGTNDMESPMPVISKPPSAFSDFEINSVIAYIQSKDGVEVTVTPPEEAQAPKEEASKGPVIANTPKELVDRLGCGMCHAIGSITPPAAIGPDLKVIGSIKDAAYIRQSIIEPNAVVAEGFMPIMPADFAHKMTAGELEMLVKFLVNAKGQGEF
jgi:mono/diheme cytochrome c family protein